MTPLGHWPRTYRYRSFRRGFGVAQARRAPPGRLFMVPGGVIPKIASNGPVTDGGVVPGPGATLDAAFDRAWSGCPLLFDASSTAMVVHDPDTLRILAVNEAAVRQYGWSRLQLLSMTVLDILPPDDRPAFLDQLLCDPVGGAAAAPVRRRHLTRDGAVIAVEVQTDTVPFGAGPVLLTVARDVTEGLRLQASLDTLGDQLRETQAVAKVGIWEWDVT